MLEQETEYLTVSEVEEIPFLPSTIETIDVGLYNWVNESLDLHTTTNGGFKKVPCLWLSAERSFQIKNNKDLRDSSGKLKLPIISINRTSMAKDPSFRGSHYAHLPDNSDYKGGATAVTRRIVQVKTRNFANADKARELKSGDHTGRSNNKKIVYETIEMPLPTYVTCNYDITIRTEYLQQLNEIITPFVTRTGGVNHFLFSNDGHKYEAFIQQDFNPESNVVNLGEDERYFETKVTIKVLGYLMGEGINREKPKVVVRENYVEVKMSRERVMVGDQLPWRTVNKQKYRE